MRSRGTGLAEQRVGVGGAASGSAIGARGRGVPASSGAELAEAARARVLRLANSAARRKCASLDELLDRVDRRDAGVGRRELAHPVVAVAASRSARAKSARISSCAASSVWLRDPAARARAPGRGSRRTAARSRRPRASCRRARRRCRSRRSGRSGCRGPGRGSAPVARCSSIGERHQREHALGDRDVEVFALARAARGAGAPRGSRSPRACRRRRCRRSWRPASGGPPSARAAARVQVAADREVVEVVAGPARGRAVLAVAARRAVDDARVHRAHAA